MKGSEQGPATVDSAWSMCRATEGRLWVLVLPLLQRNLVKVSYHHQGGEKCDKKRESVPKEGNSTLKDMSRIQKYCTIL